MSRLYDALNGADPSDVEVSLVCRVTASGEQLLVSAALRDIVRNVVLLQRDYVSSPDGDGVQGAVDSLARSIRLLRDLERPLL